MNLSEIHFPSTLQELFQLQAGLSDMCIVAGGTSFGTLQRTRYLSFPPSIVSLSRLAELRVIHKTERIISIGSACTLSELYDVLYSIHVIIPALLDSIASPAVRNIATIGGHLMYDQAYLTLLPLLAALDTELEFRISGKIEKMSLWQFIEMRNSASDTRGVPILLRIKIPMLAIDYFYSNHAGTGVFPYGKGINLVCAASFGRNSITQFKLSIAGKHAFRDAEIEQRIISTSYPFSRKSIQNFIRLYRESLKRCACWNIEVILPLIEEALDGLG